MTEIVNLRLARKRAARRQIEAEAAANRAKHGLSKEERARSEAFRDNLNNLLNQAKRDDLSD